MTWSEVLSKIRKAEEPIPTDDDGQPTIAKNLLLYELLQLLEATTSGYNMQIKEINKLKAENARLRRAVSRAFPGERR